MPLTKEREQDIRTHNASGYCMCSHLDDLLAAYDEQQERIEKLEKTLKTIPCSCGSSGGVQG